MLPTFPFTEKLPSMSVSVPSLEPFTITVAPIMVSPLSSTTCPFIICCCANALKGKDSRSIRNRTKRSCFLTNFFFSIILYLINLDSLLFRRIRIIFKLFFYGLQQRLIIGYVNIRCQIPTHNTCKAFFTHISLSCESFLHC